MPRGVIEWPEGFLTQICSQQVSTQKNLDYLSESMPGEIFFSKFHVFSV